MNYKITILTVLGVEHVFTFKDYSADQISKFRTYIGSSNTVEFTHRESGHVSGFLKGNMVGYTIESFEGGEDVGDQYDPGAR